MPECIIVIFIVKFCQYVIEIANTLNDHLKSAEKLEKKIHTRIDLLKEKNNLVE